MRPETTRDSELTEKEAQHGQKPGSRTATGPPASRSRGGHSGLAGLSDYRTDTSHLGVI